MKKTLLSAAMIIMAMSALAQGAAFLGTPSWQKSVTTVSDSTQLSATQSIVASDGSVYTTGTYNQDVTFGACKLENPDALTSAYLAKYDTNGNEQWAAGLYGSAIIRTLTTDADCNVYVAGTFAGEVSISSADGTDQQTIQGLQSWDEYIEYKNATFIAKYDKNGKLLTVRSISSDNMSASDNATNSGMYFDSPRFIPTGIAISGGKLILSATYFGNVKIDDARLTGRYTTIDFGDGMIYYQDANSACVLSFDTNLSNAMAIAELGQKDAEAADAYNRVSSIKIASDGSNVFLAAVGCGNLTLNNGDSNTTEYNFKPDDNGNTNYGFILANLTNYTAKGYECGADILQSAIYAANALTIDGSTLYLGGTVSNNNPFVANGHKPIGATDVIVTAFSISDLSQTASWYDSFNEGDNRYFAQTVSDIIVSNGKVYLSGVAYHTSDDSVITGRNYVLDAITLTNASLVSTDVLASLTKGDKSVVTTTNKGTTTTTTLYANQMTGIENIKGDNNITNDNKVNTYNLQGQLVGDSYKGIVISNGKKFFRK